MASKRNSRVYMDERIFTEKAGQPVSSSYRSRRNSRNSIRDQTAQMDSPHDAAAAIVVRKPSQESLSSSDAYLTSGDETNVTPFSYQSYSPYLGDFPTAPLEGRPLNFGVVIPGVYRSSYPKPEDYDYIKGLKLKTVITLVKKDEFDQDLHSFANHNGINQMRFYMQGTKKETIPLSTMSSILEVLLDRRNHPLMLHCNHGKHRTGCVIAVARKLSGWDLPTVLDEYRSYASPKARECDISYIAAFETAALSLAVVEAAKFSPVQIRTFFRTLLFSSFVMVIWLVSGSQIGSTSPNVVTH